MSLTLQKEYCNIRQTLTRTRLNMYENMLSGKPEEMASKEIITELIQFTKENGWGKELHCVVPEGLGQPLINRCRVWLSRVKVKNKQHKNPIKHFKLGSRLTKQQGHLTLRIKTMGPTGLPVVEEQVIPQAQEVASFFLYQTRVDRMADKANELLAELNQTDRGII